MAAAWVGALIAAASCPAIATDEGSAPRIVVAQWTNSDAVASMPDALPWMRSLRSYFAASVIVCSHQAHSGTERCAHSPRWRVNDLVLLAMPASSTAPTSESVQGLHRLATQIRAARATVAVVTPALIHAAQDSAKLRDSVDAAVGTEALTLIDLAQMSRMWAATLGAEGRQLYLAQARDDAQPAGTSAASASALSCMVAAGIVALRPDLKRWTVRDVDCVLPAPEMAARGELPSSRVIHELDETVDQPAPHGGEGRTTAHPLFGTPAGFPFVFRKRVLHRGAGIGLHLHTKDEIYYVLSGTGNYILDGRRYTVSTGHAMLTRVGSTHAILQAGDEPLVLLIAFPVETTR